MTFSEKLDFLLNLTNTPNNMLARHLSLDPSYISRLRRGERSVPHDDYIREMAQFFSRHCSEDYVRSALAATMGNSAAAGTGDAEQLSSLLLAWLTEKEEAPASRVQALLSDLSRPSSADLSRRQAAEREAKKKKNQELRMFYGMEGRRQATIALFNLALQQPVPGSLLLFSDENSKWMLENSSFSQEWSTLLWQIILAGNKVKVIHKVSRDIDEMLEVIHQWLPFYTSGAVEPYYYPRLRDGVYKRTLSVVPGKAAVFATSIGESMDSTANFMSTDKLTVDSFTNEFYSYLALCRPLLKIHASRNFDAISPDLFEFQVQPGDLIFKTGSLALITTPSSVIHDFQQRYPTVILPGLCRTQQAYAARFEEKLKTDTVFQFLRLAPLEEVVSGSFVFSLMGFGPNVEILYTRESYLLHLQNILRLLVLYEQNHVIIDQSTDDTLSLYCNEEQGVMILKEDDPPILFEITEANMKSAFWDYMYQSMQHDTHQPEARAAVIEQLRNYIARLSQTEEAL